MTNNPMELNDLITQAEKYFSANEMNAALALFEQIINLTPQDHDSHFKLGYCHYQLKNFGLAEAIFRSLSKVNSQDYQAWYYLGQCLNAQHKAQQALEAFNIAKKIDLPRFKKDQAGGGKLTAPPKKQRRKTNLNRRLQIVAAVVTIIIGGIGIYQATRPEPKVIPPKPGIAQSNSSTIFYKVVSGPFVMLGDASNQLMAAAGTYWLQLDVRFNSHCAKPVYLDPKKFALKVTRVSNSTYKRLRAKNKAPTTTLKKATTRRSTRAVTNQPVAMVMARPVLIQGSAVPIPTGSKTFKRTSRGIKKLKRSLPPGFIENGEVLQGMILFQVLQSYVSDPSYRLQLLYPRLRNCNLTLTHS